jgi:hypothetical protein
MKQKCLLGLLILLVFQLNGLAQKTPNAADDLLNRLSCSSFEWVPWKDVSDKVGQDSKSNAENDTSNSNQSPDVALRTVERNVLHSATLPELTVRVSSRLTYLGRLSYDVQGAAQAEEFVFADAAKGQLRRVFIVHFEHFLPTNEQVFNYPRLRMTTLGQQEYLHQTWAIRQFDLFTVPAMKEFLWAHHLTAEESWLVDRYVRVVDQTRKHEVIFFYLEAASTNPSYIHYGGAPAEPPPPPAPPPVIERDLLKRASAAFQVLETKGRKADANDLDNVGIIVQVVRMVAIESRV